MIKRIGTILLCFLAALNLSVAGGWTFEVQPIFRSGISVEMKGSHAGGSEISGSDNGSYFWALAQRPEELGVPADDPTAYVGRTFDDGYVQRGLNTDLFVPQPADRTWNWSYNNAGQYNAGSDTITFTRAGTLQQSGTLVDVGRRAETTTQTLIGEGTGSSFSEDTDGAGVNFSASRSLRSGGKSQLDLVLGIGGLFGVEVSSSGHELSGTWEETTYEGVQTKTYDYNQTRSYSQQYVYFDTFGVLPGPPVPNNGTYNGPGATIPLRPSGASTTYGESQYEETLASTTEDRRMTRSVQTAATATSSVDVNADQYSTFMGVRLSRRFGQRVSAYVSPRVSLNVVSVDATRQEQITAADGRTLASWSDSASDELFYAGVAGLIGIDVLLSGGWFIGVEGGYEQALNTVDLDVGPANIELDFSSVEAGFKVGKVF